MASRGIDVHGEAAFVMGYGPRSVLDAGCGSGRVAIELTRRGVDVVGVDADPSMIAEARRLAPDLTWHHEDMTELELPRQFDLVVMAGNVPIFCPPDKRRALVQACAAHLGAMSLLVCGFQLGRGYGIDEYDAACEDAGLDLVERYATWDRAPYRPEADYAVSVHRPRAGTVNRPAPLAAAGPHTGR
jgi:SAM-dependent methyltransferase